MAKPELLGNEVQPSRIRDLWLVIFLRAKKVGASPVTNFVLLGLFPPKIDRVTEPRAEPSNFSVLKDVNVGKEKGNGRLEGKIK